MGSEELFLPAVALGEPSCGDARVGEASETSRCSLACVSGCGSAKRGGFPGCAATSQQTFGVTESSIKGQERRSHKTLVGAHGD